MDDITFQCVTWDACDQVVEVDGKDRLTFVIHAFGRTEQGQSVHVRVMRFRPFLYLKVDTMPDIDTIKEYMSEQYNDDVSVNIVKARTVWGFDNGKQHLFLKISFTRASACHRLHLTFKDICKDTECPTSIKSATLFESNLEPVLRFLHMRNLPSGGWIHIPDGCYSEMDSNCDVGIQCDWNQVSRASDEIQQRRAPLRILSFDIECHSRTGRFPVAGNDTFAKCDAYLDNKQSDLFDGLKIKNIDTARRDAHHATQAKGARSATANKLASVLAKHESEEGDPIVQIGLTVHKYGDNEVCTRAILTLGQCGQLTDSTITVYRKNSERELLLHFAKLVGELDVDFVTGFNIFGFDWKYIVQRAMKLGVYDRLLSAESGLSRDLSQACTFVRKTLTSSALGDNMLYYVEMPGRTAFDLMKVIQRDHKLDSYKLDNCGEVFLNERKHDVTPQEIFAAWNADTDHAISERARVALYCVQDCELCNRLVMRLDTIPNTLAMATVCYVPPRYIFTRGQGVKIFSLVLSQCARDNMLFPTISMRVGKHVTLEDDANYSDLKSDDLAPNLPPEYDGATVLTPVPGVYTKPVAVFDYASLYPSSMISENISHDTLVMDPAFDNLPGVTYNVVEYMEGPHVLTCKFAASPEGILPKILRHLLNARKETRARAKHVKAVHVSGETRVGDKHNILDGENPDEWVVQDAYDAFEKKVLDGMQLAFKVTANSLYGQMGAVTSPVYLKPLAACTTATGRNMIMKAKRFMESEYKAHTVYGDSVAGYTPTILRVNGEIVVEKFENIAQRFGHGKWIRCVEAGRQDKESCELDGIEVWSDDDWTKVHRIIRHQLAPNKKMVRVVTNCAIVDVTDDHSLLRADKTMVSPADLQLGDPLLHHAFPVQQGTGQYPCSEEARIMGMLMGNQRMGNKSVWATDPEDTFEHLDPKHDSAVPNRILNAPYEVRKAFWDGFCDAGGDDDQKSQISALTLSMLAASLGFAVSVSQQDQHSYRVSLSDNEQPDCIAIKKLYEIPYDGIVYDLTTDNHHFAAGVGTLIVKNTDSVFVSFPDTEIPPCRTPQDALQKTKDLSVEASSKFRQLLKSPHNLEFEKIYFPFAIFTKKRYVGNKYGSDLSKFTQDSMGIVLKRRDNAPIVKHIFKGALDIILDAERHVDDAIAFVKDQVRDVLADKRDISDFTISKTLRMNYKAPHTIAHKVLADRVAQRDPGNAFQSNDRVPFVYIKSKDKTLQGNRIETPEYVLAQCKEIDYEHYITNQISKPVCQLFSLVADALQRHSRVKRDFGDSSLDRKLRECKTEKERDACRQAAYAAILQQKEKFAYDVLFGALLCEHRLRKQGQRTLHAFFKS